MLEIWKGKCSYCKMGLFLNEMEMDHLVPKHLTGHELATALMELGLADDFDIESLGNLTPMHRLGCNSSKSGRPPLRSLFSEEILRRAEVNAPKIEELALRLKSDSSIARALAVLRKAQRAGDSRLDEDSTIEQMAVKFGLPKLIDEDETGLPGLVNATLDTTALTYTLQTGRKHVTYTHISYKNSIEGMARREVWLVAPPGQQRLAVVIERDTDVGTSIQNAAERIAAAVHEVYPGFLTVLHYDESKPAAWGNWWMPVPLDGGGMGVFGSSITDFPSAAASLRLVGLRP